MIDFENCTIHSLCDPARYYAQNLSSRLEDPMMYVAEEQARKADERIKSKEYNEAIKILDDMITRLEKLKAAVQSDHKEAYGLTYIEVNNESYHATVVRAADEHGEKRCTLGALKSAKKDLENRYLH